MVRGSGTDGRRLSWAALPFVILAVACSRGAGGDAAEDRPPLAGRSATTALETRAPVDPDDALSGTWWITSDELPIRGFLLNVAAASPADPERRGRWVSFDWRATNDPEQLVRRSRPVAVGLSVEGEVLSIDAPSPMLNDRGQPNGQRGTWRLELRAVHLPGELGRYQGSAVHTELTDPTGVPVRMERTFRVWTQD